MSAKGRGPSDGGKHDAHFTPSWCVDRLLEAWAPPREGIWLEPGAGKGHIIRAMNLHYPAGNWHAVEIQERFRKHLYSSGAGVVTIANYLTGMPDVISDVSLVMGNPPYTYALEFVQMSLLLAPRAEIMLLLALNILSSDTRQLFMSTNTPDVFVLPDRPSFKASGDTDAQDYGWFRWKGGEPQSRGFVQILGSTPVSVRR